MYLNAMRFSMFVLTMYNDKKTIVAYPLLTVLQYFKFCSACSFNNVSKHTDRIIIHRRRTSNLCQLSE